MNKDLFFVPIIAKAVAQADRKASLRQAFNEIAELGQKPEYAQGLKQFRQFMEAAAAHAQEWATTCVRSEIADLVTRSADTEQPRWDLADLLEENDEWRQEREAASGEVDLVVRSPGIALALVKNDGATVGTVRLTENLASGSIVNVLPGSYVLVLDTGWTLWEGTLTGRDLLWIEAFPRQPLKLAADTCEAASECTKQIDLLDGELRLSIYPGIESGWVGINWIRSNVGDRNG